MRGFSETPLKGSIAEQMKLSAVSQRPGESSLHFLYFLFPWSGKLLWEIPPRTNKLSLEVGEKNWLFCLRNIYIYLIPPFCYCFTLFLKKLICLLLLLFVSQCYFVILVFTLGLAHSLTYSLVTRKTSQIRLLESMLRTFLVCPHLESCIWWVFCFKWIELEKDGEK